MFQSELEKYRPHQNRLIQASHKQAALMKELTGTFNNLLQDKRVRSEQSKYESVQRQRTSVINKYKRAYQEFLDLEAGLQSAKRWYNEMKETTESLQKNVETFVNNRRSEGAQLLKQIEQERAEKAAMKSSKAALEQERLRDLMERMHMETPTPSPKHRGAPAPLNFHTTSPLYPQQSFTGQYQLPSSPPPQQTTFSQQSQTFSPQSYNPSSHGRIPGPASPPPTQTTFNIGALRPGPASPPPTQTTFGQVPRPFSTYGNPAAPVQQQQPSNYVPPGFVPPPPPPGPPPLGPQQTFHYQSNDYYNGAGGAPPRPGSAQQGPQNPADPWAGLNAWR